MKLRQAIYRGVAATRAVVRMGLERIETGMVWNPATAENLRDPYPMYARFRERDPVHHSRLIDGWALFRYADVIEVLRDPRFSADERNSNNFALHRRQLVAAGALDADDPLEQSMLRMDAPDHTRLRGLVNKGFVPRAVEKLRPRVETLVKELLDLMHGRDVVDVIEALAYPLPVIVISELIGVPGEDRARFKHWSDEVVRSMGFSSIDDVRRSRIAAKELRAYFEGIAALRRRDPRDDLVSALLSAEEQGDKLSSSEVFSTLTLLLVAGNETTTNLIANGLHALLRNRDQLELLRGDPDLIASAVEELLRYDSPVQATSRIALEDVEIGGRPIRKGQEVIVTLGSANRDPEQFEAPDRLDLTRRDNRHLSFGHGAHFCLGSPLARLEAQVAFRALLERYPNLTLATDAVEWRRNMILRGPTALPVRLR
jgi:hypothetical protein